MGKRSTILKLDSAALGASTTIALGAPSWAKSVILTLEGTADGTGAASAKLRYKGAGAASAAADILNAATPALATTATSRRVAAVGPGLPSAAGGATAPATANAILSRDMEIVVTESAGAVTNAKVWAEFSD